MTVYQLFNSIQYFISDSALKNYFTEITEGFRHDTYGTSMSYLEPAVHNVSAVQVVDPFQQLQDEVLLKLGRLHQHIQVSRHIVEEAVFA